MLPGAVRSLKRSPRGVGDVFLGSWARTFIVAAVLLVAFALVAWLAVAGQLSDLRYANVPLVHPYPPAGYYQNPFNPTDRGDLINAAEANRVKADLTKDGDYELDAFGRGDPGPLARADTGRSLERLQALIAQNNSSGVVQRADTHLDSVVVGHLADPNDRSITWCIEEKGSATISHVAKSSGQVIRTQSYRFVGRYWLVQVDGRYLIADAQVNIQSGGTG
jgi:hypothetical protein